MNQRDFEKISNALRDLSELVYNLAQNEKTLKYKRLLLSDNGETENRLNLGQSSATEVEQERRHLEDVKKLFLLSPSADAEQNEASQLNYPLENNEGHFCNFTEKEINKMPRPLRNEFRKDRYKAKIRKRENGTYEIRCQIKYQKITASSKNLQIAKENFIKKLQLLESQDFSAINKRIKLKEYMEQWLENVKKPYVKEDTFKSYIQACNCYIYPVFANREMNSIRQLEIQALINGLAQKDKCRTAIKVYQLLCSLFEYAEIDDIVKKSPMLKIIKPKYEQEKGDSLTRDEEKILINRLKADNRPTFQAYAFIIYTGLRRSELQTIEIDNAWIKVKTAKQRKGLKEKTREIPISPMLKKVLPFIDVDLIKRIPEDTLTREIKLVFKNHHLHELRHTFITRCQECGIQRELVSLWAGHSADTSITSTVYTHLGQNKQHQIEEMQKYSYDF